MGMPLMQYRFSDQSIRFITKVVVGSTGAVPERAKVSQGLLAAHFQL